MTPLGDHLKQFKPRSPELPEWLERTHEERLLTLERRLNRMEKVIVLRGHEREGA